MKFLNKFFTLGLLVSSMAFTACDYEDDYTPAPQPGEGEAAVVFAGVPANSYTLDMAATEFPVTLQRTDSVGEETVEIVAEVIGADASALEVPSTVTFADGDTIATLTINIKDTFPLAQKVKVYLSIVCENPYITATKATVELVKEDYKVVAVGMYEVPLFGLQYEAGLQYSESMKLYRFKDCWSEGDVVFKWAGKDSSDIEHLPSTSIFNYPAFATGIALPDYGNFFASPEGGMYDATNDCFIFTYLWLADAGFSFGTWKDTFTVTEWVE